VDRQELETAKPTALSYIQTSGRQITTRMSDQSEHREQWQMVIFLILALGALHGIIQLISSVGGPLSDQVHSAMNFVVPLAIYSGVCILVGFFVSWKRMSAQTEIRIIRVTFDGFDLGNKRTGGAKPTHILWSDVEAIEIIEEAGGDSVLYLATRSLKIYKMKAANAFAWVDAETFFVELKANAPNAMLNFAHTDIAIGDQQSTRYTNLWLQYFSSPDTRARRGALPNGAQLNDGRYRVLKRLGGGGQGTIYLATAKETDLRLDQPLSDDDERLVVLKEFVLPVHRGSALAERQYALLNEESQLLGRINHPSIVKLLDCFVEDHRGYIVLDYVDGDSLKELVKQNGPLQEALVREVGIAICDILRYLHNFRPAIVHRDLTPDNLLCNADGQIILIDFTVALQLQSTRTASVVGKQAYIPPEQFRGLPSVQSDIYALGCTMQFLLTGEDPEPMQQSHPAVKNADVSAAMDAIVARATAFDEHDRYSSAEDFKRDLEALSV
jgi:hypothetical protein